MHFSSSSCLFAIVIGSVLLVTVKATSMKMDYLPLGDVRTDPIINPDCLSNHVHTFYGAAKMRPETTYDDLLNADANSGNVVENMSLYWHPTVYEVHPDTNVHSKVDIYFASTYYIWTTGEAKAFPDGFKMIAGFNGISEARAGAECVAPFDCERDNCETDDTSFFPATGCAELEASMAFPTCWDGINIDSNNHMSHVAYDIDGGVFDGECPESHPVKLPEIQFFFRIAPYSGGKHAFADGSSFYHADYFSGWKQTELQTVLDTCENESEAACPDAWCEDKLTFRDAPKVFGEDSDIVDKLKPLQPNPPVDTTTITTEIIDNTATLPRGKCTGTLIPAEPTSPTTSAPASAPAVSPTGEDSECTDSELRLLVNRKIKTCKWVAQNPLKRCSKKNVSTHCPLTCDSETKSCARCVDSKKKFLLVSGATKRCGWAKNKNTESRCAKDGMDTTCQATCGFCE